MLLSWTALHFILDQDLYSVAEAKSCQCQKKPVNITVDAKKNHSESVSHGLSVNSPEYIA